MHRKQGEDAGFVHEFKEEFFAARVKFEPLDDFGQPDFVEGFNSFFEFEGFVAGAFFEVVNFVDELIHALGEEVEVLVGEVGGHGVVG